MIRKIVFADSFTMFFWGVTLFLMASATAVHILYNRREEHVSTVLWLFVVYTFPLFGIVFYILFGINKIYTTGAKIKSASDKFKIEKKRQIHPALKQHLEIQKKHAWRKSQGWEYPRYNKMLDHLLPETIPLSGNKIELLIDGTCAYPKMLKEIEKAKKHIHLQSFIIMNDQTGREILSLLEKKSKEGVKVKLIYDRFGSLKAGKNLFQMRSENFKAKPFSILNLSRPFAVQLRNHRKLLVIDGEKAFVGGINISSENDARFCTKRRYIHDLHCLIEGPSVGDLQFSFLNDWHYVSGQSFNDFLEEDFFPPLSEKENSVIRVVASGPGQCDNGTEKLFTTAALSAEKSLWIMTPYFVPDIPYWKMLCGAAAKGVDVRIIIPQKNNHWFVQYATENLFPTLLDAGIRIFLKRPPFNHAKATLIDNSWSIMGSSNCDVRSFKLNYELDFVASSGNFINTLHNQFICEMNDSDEIQLNDIVKRSFKREMLCRACSLFTPVL